MVIFSIQSTIPLVPHVPQEPITSGTLAFSLAIIRLFHSAFIAAREYFDVPEPKEYGPLSVEPPSILIMSGLFLTPLLRASKSKPRPRTPEGTNTFIGIII